MDADEYLQYEKLIKDIEEVLDDANRSTVNKAGIIRSRAYVIIAEHDKLVYERGHHDTLNRLYPVLEHAGCDMCCDKMVMSLDEMERMKGKLAAEVYDEIYGMFLRECTGVDVFEYVEKKVKENK